MSSLTQLFGDPTPLLDRVFVALEQDGIDMSEHELDHFCYRVDTNERYEELKEQTYEIAEHLDDEIISGRPISVFHLHEPFCYKDRVIHCFELPAPKAIPDYPEGWEHVEFVIEEDFIDFMKKYPSSTFITSGQDKEINQEIRINYDGFTVKFHHQTLEYVVKYLQ